MGNMTLANDAKSVDDVLASIRKLVSDETRARSLDAAKKAAQNATVDETLMLTPELKVASEQPLILETPAAKPTLVVTDADEVPTDETIETPDNDTIAPFQDEVALRALVSEMIREELQGELGNRITRNVRKLVRREIEQAMKDRAKS